MKKSLMFVLVGVLLIGTTGFASALTIYNTSFELADWSYENHAKLIEPDDTCEECAVFATLDDLVDNGDGTYNTSIYLNGASRIATVVDANTSDTDIPQLVTGVLGNAIQLDGNMYIDTGINSQAQGWSIVVAVKFLQAPDSSTLINICGQAYNDVRLAWRGNSNSLVVFQKTDGNEITLDSKFTPELNKWYLLEAVWMNGLQKFVVYDYETRQKLLEKTWSYSYSTINHASNNLLLGKWGAASAEYPHLIIDEFRFYENRAPTDNEVQVILNLGRYRLALWQGNETSLPGYLNATLFCPLDSLDTTNNVTPCYLNKEEVNATVLNIENVSLVSGKVLNALQIMHGSYVSVSSLNIPTNVLTIVGWVWVKDIYEAYQYPDVFDLFYDSFWARHIRLELFTGTGTSGTEKFNLIIGNGTTSKGLSTDVIQNIYEPHFFAIKVDFSSKKIWISIDLSDWSELDFSDMNIDFTEFRYLRIGEDSTTLSAEYIEDEFAIYTRLLTDNELNLLYHLSRHKTAALSAPSATFDGSQFLVNVTAQLPNDGKSYVLPAPKDAQGLTAIGQIGNFTFLNAGTASEVSYTFTATPGQAVPGLAYLGIETDTGVYAYGTGNMTLSVQRTKLLYNNNDAPVNIISAGKVTAVSWSGLGTLQEIKASTLELLSGGGQVRVDKFSLEDTKLNVLSLTNPIKIRATLLPVTEYKITRDLNLVQEANTNEDAVMTFVLDNTGAWEVFKAALGASIAMDYIMKVMVATIIVAIFAMLVVEKTPVKFDDNATKAIIAMITIVVLIALVKVLILTR